MSTYYCYYLGREKDGKIYPLGNFDHNGKIYPIRVNSWSFNYNFDEWFCDLPEDMYSDELKKYFKYDPDNYYSNLRYIKESELPKDDFVKSGYFLTDDIERYINDPNADSDDLFYDELDPTTYAIKMHNELTFGAPKPKMDDYGGEYTPNAASDYGYFAYPDYFCKEYMSFLCKQAIAAYSDSEEGMHSYQDPINYVILLRIE